MIRTSFTCAALSLVLGLALGACRGGSNSDDDGGDDAGIDGFNAEDATIYDIQGSLPVGTQVNIRGVVVTAIDNYGVKKGNIWVQEPDGGPFSGVLVFGAPLDQVAALEVGDLVDVESVIKDEFALTDDTSGRTTTEMTPPDGGAITVTKVGDGTPAVPEPVDALEIGTLATQELQDAEWEKWEGVLIRVDNVSVNGSIRTIGDTDPTFTKFPVTGPLQVESTMAAFPDTGVDPGDCLTSVTGVGDYFYDWLLEPRDTTEIAVGGADCPAQEAADDTCGDSLDNDADGFSDCDDFSCGPIASCATDTTVDQVQTGSATGHVTLTGVVITALSKDGKHLWVADALAGASNHGIYVYRGGSAAVLGAEFVLGATVDVGGLVSEFDPNSAGDTLTEINAYADDPSEFVTFIAAPAGLPTPLTGVTAATVADITATGEPYESVLVQLTSVKVTAVSASGNRITLTDASGSATMDDDIFVYTNPSVNDCLTVTGIMSVDLTADQRKLFPRQALDIVPATGCI
jgi:hypothetical protein